MRPIPQSSKLKDVCYDIRGPVLREANRMEEEGQNILKFNIGNPAAFGLDAPDEILQDVIHNLPQAQGYSDAKGLFAGRKAVMQHFQNRGIQGVEINDIYLGNGVSELIVMAMQALLENGDQVLIPAPDYPLWTAAVSLCGAEPVHYRCDESAGWMPDMDDLRRQITSRTRAIVVINPNNPTGAVYSQELLEQIVELARQHGLILLADEIYEKILYDGAEHVPMAKLAADVPCLSFSGLSKAYRLAGFRAGWMVVSGPRNLTVPYMDGFNVLASMRMCANVPAQYAIQTALGGYQSIADLVLPRGRLGRQRDLAWEWINTVPGLSCVKPQGAIYLFPRMDRSRFKLVDDERLVLDLLMQEKLLLVQGSAFHWPEPDHFRLVFLPAEDELKDAINRLRRFFSHYQQNGDTLPAPEMKMVEMQGTEASEGAKAGSGAGPRRKAGGTAA